MNFFYFFSHTVVKIFFRVFYGLRIIGISNIYKGGAFIAPNHTSYYDPPLIGVSWPEEVHFLAYNPFFERKIFGYLIKRLNAHPIYNSVKDVETFKIVKQLIKNNQKVVIFPEGEIVTTGRLGSLKPGLASLALFTKVPIIPAYIEGAFEVWPAKRKFPRLGKRITCIFGEPIFVDEYLKWDKKTAISILTEKIHHEIEELRLKLHQ